MNTTPKPHEMDRAVRARDASYDGVFFVAVRTTGIFCRPSCPSRPALPINRRFYPSARAAAQAGYRPCKRCRPLDTDGRPPAWIARILTEIDRDPTARLTDSDLRARRVDPARARRYFLKHHGMTFQAYCRRRRMGQALKQIRQGAGVDDVAFGNGYESSSGFRQAFRQTFGRAPADSRGADCISVDWVESPVGPLVVAAIQEGVCMVEFSDPVRLAGQFERLRGRLGRAVVPGSNRHLDALKEELRRYFEGKLRKFTVPLVYPGRPFQVAAWEEMRRIPYGQTISYEAQARAIGCPDACRAVGRANGQNTLAIVIPCHRVVNKSGQLGGYGGGLWRKQFLLDLERGEHTLWTNGSAAPTTAGASH